MAQALFGTALVVSRGRARRALPVSLAVHSAALAVAVWASAIAAGPLPPVAQVATPVVLGWPRPPAGSVAAAPVAAPRVQPPRVTPSFTAPQVVPDTLPAPSTLESVPADESSCAGCVIGAPDDAPGWSAGGGDDGDGGDSTGTASTAPASPVRAGGDVRPPAKLVHVAPEYPVLAQRAGVQGTVEIECVIDPQGNVVRTRVVRGIALLDGAALEAVGRWKYAPSRLNRVPVPVIMTVSVHFRLR